MSTVLDVLRFLITDNRELFPVQQEDGSITQPVNTTEAHIRLWRSSRALSDQLRKETLSTTEEELANHLDHVLSKRAEIIFTMVRDHAERITSDEQIHRVQFGRHSRP